MKTKKTKQQQIKHEEEYIAFLEKRLASENYKAEVGRWGIEKVKDKLKKARMVLKLLKG